MRLPSIGFGSAALVFFVAACPAKSSAPNGQPGRSRAATPEGAFDREGVNDDLMRGCWTAKTARCDPRTNGGCNTAAGQVCEIGQDAAKAYTLQCFPPPNPQKLGEACNRTTGPYCAATLHCAVDGTCRHFCCSDIDCTGRDKCIALPGGTFGTIGVCAKGPFDAGTDGS
jgi:hypothetical protein